MAKTRTRNRSGQFTKTRSHPTSLARSSPRTVTKYRTRTVVKTRPRRRGSSRGGGSMQGKIMHWGWAIMAYDMANGFLHNADGSFKLPVVFADAGEEGSIALAAHFFDADKFVPGIEDFSMIKALDKLLSGKIGTKPGEGGGFKF